MSASAENCNEIVTDDQVVKVFADISKYEKLRHTGLKKSV